jgi:multiple sugar transport system permease protein/raffinose/stachyose/melibiose transport system permease protein
MIERKMIKKKYPDDGYGHLLILPCYIIYILFVFLPVLMTIWYSFRRYDLFSINEFIGIQNYLRLVTDPLFLISFKNTFLYALGTIIPQLVFGLLLALGLNRNIAGKNVLRLAFYMPYLVSMVSVSMLWLWIYNPDVGVLNTILKSIGLKPKRWLFDQDIALRSLMMMGVWKMLGYNMVLFLSGLQQIPRHLYEAAEIDGIGHLKQLFHITIPLLQPTTFFLFVINTIQSFAVFEQVNIMTSGGPNNATTTIVHQLYTRGFVNYQMGYACSMGVILLLITLLLTALNFRYGKEGNDLL